MAWYFPLSRFGINVLGCSFKGKREIRAANPECRIHIYFKF